MIPLLRTPPPPPPSSSPLSPRGSGRWLSAAGRHFQSAAAPSPYSRRSSTSWCPPRTHWSWGTAEEKPVNPVVMITLSVGNKRCSNYLCFLGGGGGSCCFLQLFFYFLWFHGGFIKDSSWINWNFCSAQISLRGSALTFNWCHGFDFLLLLRELDFIKVTQKVVFYFPLHTIKSGTVCPSVHISWLKSKLFSFFWRILQFECSFFLPIAIS